MKQIAVGVPEDPEGMTDRELFEVIGHIQRVRYEVAEAEHRMQSEIDRRREGGE